MGEVGCHDTVDDERARLLALCSSERRERVCFSVLDDSIPRRARVCFQDARVVVLDGELVLGGCQESVVDALVVVVVDTCRNNHRVPENENVTHVNLFILDSRRIFTQH